MTRRPKQPPPAETPAPDADAILQVKVWLLLDISPMVWRRLLVPSSYTLRELHGVIQVAMGWEGIHLYDFGTLRPLFEKWYPGLANDNSAEIAQAEAA